ncbi:asparaginase [Russula earlei]|uniref:Asparaginase n=1 Tax=Russula earlei TaxID=71964 RepID=A0ACC0TWV0_9AGAM|nr:asparaginase [Russula earlei]
MSHQARDTTSRPFYLVAVHGGAGYHSPVSDSSVNRNLRAAISSTLATFAVTTAPVIGAASSTIDNTHSSGSSSALDAVTTLIAALEDAPDFNAGYGSNLTFDGDVECDASLMSSTAEDGDGDGDGMTVEGSTAHPHVYPPSSPPSPSSFSFGSVGAVPGVRNPVLLARRVLEGRRRRRPQRREPEQASGPGRDLGLGLGTGTGTGTGTGMGRVPPLMLVGEGAVRFARAQGVPVVDSPREMVAPRAREEWAVWRERLGRWKGEERASAWAPAEGGGGPSDHDPETLGIMPVDARQDTVGAVVLVGGDDVRRQERQVAAGVSSGGLLLKHPGRVGEAAIFGAGCWAERSSGGRSVACSVSGQGELIVQSSLARTLAERIAASAEDEDGHDILRSVLVDQFYGRWRQRGEHQPAVGVLLITQGMNGSEHTARLWCAFTTQSMAIAYASSRHPKPKATVLRNTAHEFRNDDDGRPPLFIASFPC